MPKATGSPQHRATAATGYPGAQARGREVETRGLKPDQCLSALNSCKKGYGQRSQGVTHGATLQLPWRDS